MYSAVTWKPWKTKKGNEGLLEICRKLFVVTKSGVTGGSGPWEQCDRRLFMGCLKIAAVLTGQLKFNMSGSLCQQACHLNWLYECFGVCGVQSSQQFVIKDTAEESKPALGHWAVDALVLPATHKTKSSHIRSSMITRPQNAPRIESPWQRLNSPTSPSALCVRQICTQLL